MSVKKKTILVVDDERDQREPLAQYLQKYGYRTFTAEDGEAALKLCKDESIDVALTDMRMPRMNGLELTRKIRELHKGIHVMVFTAHGTIQTAVDALKNGAFDYALKPVVFEDIRRKLDAVTNESGSEQDDSVTGVESIIGESPQILKLKKIIQQVAPVDSSVTIQGESGVGKELVARALHEGSSRRKGAFVPVNCAAIPESLLESELFGYKRGAFTGASADKKGFFELANNGSILLDEIADLPLPLQAKLLRALENREVYPVGASKPVTLNARVIVASGKPLSEEAAQGRFREDLYYRVSVIEIQTPPLRERTGDVQLLAEAFLKRLRERMNLAVERFSPAALEALEAYSWPGNVRELRNVVERAAVLCNSPVIETADLPEHLLDLSASSTQGTNLKTARREFEKNLVLKTLASCNNDKKQAAQLLGIGLSSLYRKLEELGIEE